MASAPRSTVGQMIGVQADGTISPPRPPQTETFQLLNAQSPRGDAEQHQCLRLSHLMKCHLMISAKLLHRHIAPRGCRDLVPDTARVALLRPCPAASSLPGLQVPRIPPGRGALAGLEHSTSQGIERTGRFCQVTETPLPKLRLPLWVPCNKANRQANKQQVSARKKKRKKSKNRSKPRRQPTPL